MIDQGGKKYVVHPTKGGFVFVFDRKGKPVNVYKGVDNINFVQDIKPDGTVVGRRDLAEGKHKNLCPAIAGGFSWNAGSYSPKTGLFYKVGYEWCIDLEVVKTEPDSRTGGSAQHRRELHVRAAQRRECCRATCAPAIRSPAR